MEKPPYEKKGLEEGILNAVKNIQTFETAIEKERKTISRYEFFIFQIEQYEKQVKEDDSKK